MRLILLFALLFAIQPSLAQGDPDEVMEDVEVELEDVEDEEEYEDEEDEGPRTPPPPPDRFRKASKRFSAKRPTGFNRGAGGGVDRMGKTEGQINFELVDPPKYYKKKNRPYLMPNSPQN